MGRNLFFLKQENVVLKVYKTLIRPHIEHVTQIWAPVLRHGNYSVILRLDGI